EELEWVRSDYKRESARPADRSEVLPLRREIHVLARIMDFMRILLLSLFAGSLFAAQPLVVISVDGLDNRYLAEADQRGLKIPSIRKLMHEGQYSRGIIGVMPTITWPSHTTILTGADPVTHGILSNWRPPGDRYLDYSQIKAPNLIGAAHQAGLKIAAITW